MTARSRGRTREHRAAQRGGVSILAIAVVVLAGVMALGIGRLGHAVSDRARADTASEGAALAAAGALAQNRGAPAAIAAARETALSNGARLTRCVCAGRAAVVEVRVGAATGRARAEVRLECFADTEHC